MAIIGGEIESQHIGQPRIAPALHVRLGLEKGGNGALVFTDHVIGGALHHQDAPGKRLTGTACSKRARASSNRRCALRSGSFQVEALLLPGSSRPAGSEPAFQSVFASSRDFSAAFKSPLILRTFPQCARAYA